jgi:ABC-type sugar transport system permease subunit
VMTFIFSPIDGPINMFLLQLGLIDFPVEFLSDPDTALWTVVAVYIWKWFGVTMIYWLAALQVVPRDLYEAARIDGASAIRMHRSITLPMILPFALVIVLITVVSALNIFGLVQTMTGGGPFFATEVMELYIYRNAFGAGQLPRLGYASAAAIFFGVTVLTISLLQGWGLKKANAARAQMKG